MLQDLRTAQPNVFVPSVHEVLQSRQDVLGDHDGAVVGLFRGAQDGFRAVEVDFVVRGVVDQTVDGFNATCKVGGVKGVKGGVKGGRVKGGQGGGGGGVQEGVIGVSKGSTSVQLVY